MLLQFFNLKDPQVDIAPVLHGAKPSACSVGWWLMAGAGLF
jgi:hypothetical protein